MGTAVAVPYGSPVQGQSLQATSATTAEWGYSAWDASTVTAAAGAQAGTSPPAPVVAAGSTIIRGSLTCGTGSGSPATGLLVAVTFGSTLPAIPNVLITPTTSAMAALYPVVTIASVSTTGFSVTVTSPGTSQANTVYGVAWFVSL
jgi:hypothetical protein